ncbi:MAG: hypothetical protein HY616_03230 [Candidatus Rokubacteria bacterium]|nr:hypothetical protein [Candidatus Rokubacteria bacterium]
MSGKIAVVPRHPPEPLDARTVELLYLSPAELVNAHVPRETSRFGVNLIREIHQLRGALGDSSPALKGNTRLEQAAERGEHGSR